MYVILIFTFTLICMCYTTIEGQFPPKVRILVNCILVVFFSVLVACRPLTVPDTEAYIYMYKQIDVHTRYPIVNLMVPEFDAEVGYMIFCQASKFFFGEAFRLFMFIIPIINISLIAYGSKKIIQNVNKDFSDSKEFEYSFALILCLYTSFFGLMYNGIVLRAGLALSLTICSLAMYLDKKYMKMIILFIIAFTFHKMALVGVFAIVIFHLTSILKRSNYFIVWLLIGAIAVSGLGNRIIEPIITMLQMLIYKIPILSSYTNYLSDYTSYVQYGYKSVFFYFVGLILLFWKVNSKIYYKLLNVYYVGLTMMVFLNNINGARRIYEFMTVYVVLLLYILYRYSKMEKTLIWILILGIVLISNVLALNIWNVF